MKPPPEKFISRQADPPRKRTLSEEERALWEEVARQAKPLRKKHFPATPSALVQAEARTATKAAARPKLTAVAKSSPPMKPAVPPLAPIGRRERLQLSRGRKEIEARLDLHGMTQLRAHRALSAFLHRAHSEGLSFVLIITGKGKIGAESERGVLRRQVPQWLSQPEFRGLIVGFEEAHVGHGGAGALYVRIRRSRI
jgi:DNA-nicking Smr family endonuclease